MSVYFTTLALISILLIAYSYRGTKQDLKTLLFALVTVILVFVAGFRYHVGTDYLRYYQNYSIYKLGTLSFFSQPGLTVVAWIAELIYDDPGTWFLLMAVITIVPVMKTIRDNSETAALGVLMFLFLGCWHYSFNLVKQSVAAAIIFAAYPAIRDRRIVRWCIACVIGAMFHISALLMIPVYFLAGTKITTKRTMLIIVFGVAVMVFSDTLFSLINILKQGENLVSKHWDITEAAVNSLRILVNCVPVLLFILLRSRYDKDDADFAMLFNLSLINALLNVATMNSIYLNRFCVYTNFFNILFIPHLFKPLKTKLTCWIPPLAVILYFAYWSYDLYKGSSTVVFNWIFHR